MAENEDELLVIVEALHEFLPSFPVSRADFEHPSSNFVINLYGNLINKIVEETAGEHMENPSLFTSVINLNDEESSIFSIYNYIHFVYVQLGYEFFNLTDLYCPTAKRTKCICKTLIMIFDSLQDVSGTFSDIENRVLQKAKYVKEKFDLRDKLKRELSDKANLIGALKTETDKLVLKYSELQKQERNSILNLELEKNRFLQEKTTLNKKMEMLLRQEERVSELEKEQTGLQENVVSSEDVENLKDSIVETQNRIRQLDEEIEGYEGCLQTKSSELNAYEEVSLMLNRLQITKLPKYEKLNKLRLCIKTVQEEISSLNKNLLELEAAKEKQKERNKQLKKDIAEKQLDFDSVKDELILKLRLLEKEHKEKRKSLVHLQEIEKELVEQMNFVKKHVEDIEKNYKGMQEQFDEACNEIITSANKTTETVRAVLTEIGNKVNQVYGN